MSISENKRVQLQQKMPVVAWQFKDTTGWQFKGTTIESTSCNYLPLPQVVQCWEEFEKIQDSFLLSMEREYTRSPPVAIGNLWRHKKSILTKGDVRLSYLRIINTVLEILDLDYEFTCDYPTSRRTKHKQKGILRSREIMELAGELSYHLDTLYVRESQNSIKLSQPVVVVEPKKVNFFRKECDGVLPDLVVDHNFDVSKRQIYTYMSCTKTGYGILSSGDASFFFKREATDSGESILKISKCILWDDLLIPMAAFCWTAFLDMYKYNEEPKRFYDSQNDEESEEKEPSSDKDDETEGTYRPIKITKEAELSHIRTRSKASTSDINAATLSLSISTILFASGSYGKIYLGKVNGCKVAVKMTLCGTALAEALENEVIMYKKLKAFWGQYVPALLSYGTLAEGRVVYLATEFVESLELGKEVVTSTVMEAAVTALQAIHSCSILHGDVSMRNILVVDHGQGGVCFIDFGLSQFTSDKSKFQQEIAQLKS